jgi:hypothetical protein
MQSVLYRLNWRTNEWVSIKFDIGKPKFVGPLQSSLKSDSSIVCEELQAFLCRPHLVFVGIKLYQKKFYASHTLYASPVVFKKIIEM